MIHIPRGLSARICSLVVWNVCGMLVASPGQAQQREPRGIRFWDGRLDPYAEIDARVARNPGRLPQTSAALANDLAFAARPGFDFTRSSEDLEVKAGLAFGYQNFFDLEDKGTSELSSFAGNLNLGVSFNRRGAYGFELQEKLERSADPANQTNRANILRWSNDVGLVVHAKPGGGALQITPGYRFAFDLFDASVSGAQNLDNLRHQPKLRVGWRFLPKTEFFVEGDALLTNYPNAEADSGTRDSSVLQAMLGATGAVTARITATLQAGYGQTFTSGDPTEELQSVVGQAELRYIFSDTVRFALGYGRGVQPTPEFKWVLSDRGYFRLDGQFGRFGVRGETSFSLFTFGQDRAGVDRSDTSIAASVSVNFFALEWMSVSIVNTFELRDSSYVSQRSTEEDYFTNDMYIRTTLRY